MDQISKRINYTNHNIHFYEKMSKMVVKLGSKKGENKKTPFPNYPVYRIHY